MAQVLNLLLKSCDSEEECRNVVAECLGHLALLAPAQIVPVLQQNTGAPSASMRAAVVTAVKYTIVDQPHSVDALLASSLPSFLALLSDPDRSAPSALRPVFFEVPEVLRRRLSVAPVPFGKQDVRQRARGLGRQLSCVCRHVRKAVVQLLSIAAHNKAELVRRHLAGLLPLLYQQTVIDDSLIRTVDLGPFKHKIDDGLELRKAAFECMDVLLENAGDRLFLPDFIKHLRSGIDVRRTSFPCRIDAPDPERKQRNSVSTGSVEERVVCLLGDFPCSDRLSQTAVRRQAARQSSKSVLCRTITTSRCPATCC